MHQRRKRILVAIALTIAIAASCSFPEVTFRPDTDLDSGTIDGPTGDSRAGDSPTADARSPVGANEDVDPKGKDQDATVIADGDTGKVVPEAGCCDCDGDQVAAPDGGSCGGLDGGDCDDTIKYVYPGSGFVVSSQWFSAHTPTFDWNCDGVVTVQYSHGLGACNTRSKLSVAATGGCAGIGGGFVGDPACGASDKYVIQCKDDAFPSPNCTDGVVETRTQGCR